MWLASHADVLRGSSRVPVGTRDAPLRMSAGEANLWLACVAGVRKGRGRKLERETTRKGGGRRGIFPFFSFLPRAPKFPLPLPF